MSAPSDPQPTSAFSPPAEPNPASATRMLDEIRERMERLEGHLSLRERRVARLERALREADAKLRSERAKISAEREAIEKDLPRQLREREQQLEAADRARREAENRLEASSAAERELQARIESLTQERDQAVAELELTRRELQQILTTQHEQEHQAVQSPIQRDAPQAAAYSTPEPGDILLSPVTTEDRVVNTAMAHPTVSRRRRIAITLALAALPIICGLSAVFTWRHYPRTYQIHATLTLPAEPGDAVPPIFENYPATPASPRLEQIEIRRVASPPTLVASMLARNREAALVEIDTAMRGLLERISAAASQPAAQPARQARRDELQAELERLDARMVALAAPPPGTPASPAELLATWRQTLSERQAIDTAIAELDAQLQRKPPDPAEIVVSPEQLQAAIAAEPRLVADSDVLAQREAALAQVLREITDTARPAFTGVEQTAAIADKHFEEILATRQDPDVEENVRIIRESVANNAGAAAALFRIWQEEYAAIEDTPAGSGIAAHYQTIEVAARRYLESTANAVTVIERSLDQIGEGGDEPTKRLVLRNTLAQHLKPPQEARETLATAVRRVIPSENVELGALVQSVSGLSHQVSAHRARLEQMLRGQILANRRAAYDREMQGLRTRREELVRKAADMDAAVVQNASEALALLGTHQDREAALKKLIELTRRRQELSAELAALETEAAEAAAAADRLANIEYAAPVAEDVTSAEARIWATTAAGSIPALLAFILTGFIWAIRAWRQSQSEWESYTKALRSNPQPDISKTQPRNTRP